MSPEGTPEPGLWQGQSRTWRSSCTSRWVRQGCPQAEEALNITFHTVAKDLMRPLQKRKATPHSRTILREKNVFQSPTRDGYLALGEHSARGPKPISATAGARREVFWHTLDPHQSSHCPWAGSRDRSCSVPVTALSQTRFKDNRTNVI